jgi:mono/diheme cytochrome c family protein
MLDKPERMRAYADRIYVRVYETKTMPLGNLTGASDDERRILAAWVAQGADVEAPGPVELPPPPAPKLYATPADEARAIFTERCAPCHGAEGRGDGPSASSLNPKPRDYHDAQWQASATGDGISKAILGGGPAVGKSSLMPSNPDLLGRPVVVAELVKIVRGFGHNP